MSPGTRHRTEPPRNGQGSDCRWGTGHGWQAPGAPARRPERGPSSTQERRGQPEGSPREAPQERTRGLQARPAVQVGAPRRGRTPPGETQLPASPRRAAMRCQWPYLTVLRTPSSDSSGAKRLRVLTAQDGAEWAEGGAAGRAAARPRPRPAPSRPPPGAPRHCSAPPPLRGATAATGRRCGHVDGGRAGLGGDPRGQGCGWGAGRDPGGRGAEERPL